jgi:hypothetical protein
MQDVVDVAEVLLPTATLPPALTQVTVTTVVPLPITPVATVLTVGSCGSSFRCLLALRSSENGGHEDVSTTTLDGAVALAGCCCQRLSVRLPVTWVKRRTRPPCEPV